MDNEVRVLPGDAIGRRFVSDEWLPAGADEHHVRDTQVEPPKGGWRALRSDEVETLVKNNNYADDWDRFLVADPFDPGQIKNNRFFGLVRVGRVRHETLEYHDLQLPVGITNSLIISADIGSDCAIHDVHYLAHTIIGERCILFNLDEVHTTSHAKFGNGILKDGEPESVRVWLDLMNETGGRGVLAFDGMLAADAYLWAKYRDDAELLSRLQRMTQSRYDSQRGYYATIGEQCVIKNSRILKDVKVGPHCYIKGANKLKNLTINSSAAEPSQIGEGVELVNGIVGYGCHIFYGCKAVRFVLGDNSHLKYGARLINSFLGDNSTISCCEVLNNLIFPAHEQHHNNSFLVAAVVMGQSNIAAGATIGSNHNSRANDNELVAGRGFWPGLCTSLKHSSRFASFVLISKADYPAELDIPFPFALVNNNTSRDRLEVTPAFWWVHNMYALARNTWKFHRRDARARKSQHIEFDYLAPDTAEEILAAMRLLERYAGVETLRSDDQPDAEPIDAKGLEKSRRGQVILHARRGYQAYRQMLEHYGLTNVIAWLEANPDSGFSDLRGMAAPSREWVNLGGQLVATPDVDRLRADVGSGALPDWEAVHARYDELWSRYPDEKAAHAYAVLCEVLGVPEIIDETWPALLDRAVEIRRFIADEVYRTRKKDFDNPFRQATFRSPEEMNATVGAIEDNDFVQRVREDTERFTVKVAGLKQKRETR
ncbi:MAG TPA: DUF4954 family protein [Spirochaetia bacterium]|nr:DUF4954 family protein [Spirochaetia bacterium]